MSNEVIKNNSEILFLWSANMCNPNGDMMSDNAPRFDDGDEKAIVSDVRVKRTIRDDMQFRKLVPNIFVDNELILSEGLKAEKRFDKLKDLLKDKKDEREIFLSCIDNRLFGGVAPKSGIQLTGTVQFIWSKTLNKTEQVFSQGTGAFATEKKKDQNENIDQKVEEASENARFQKTFRADNYIPFGVFALYGSVNKNSAKSCQTTNDDISQMIDSLWMGTKFLNTRSKEGQKSRLLLKIDYTEQSNYFIGLLNELVELTNERSGELREFDECKFDFARLAKAIKKAISRNIVEKVKITIDENSKNYESIKKAFESIDGGKIEFVDELDLLQKA